MKTKTIGVFALGAAALASFARAVPPTLGWSGHLTDSAGNPITGTRTLTLRFYNQSAGGTELWSRSYPAVQISSGAFALELSGGTPDLSTVNFETSEPWLEVQVESELLSPRIRLQPAAFARFSSTASVARALEAPGSLDPARRLVIDPNGNVGIGTTNPLNKLQISGAVEGLALRLDDGAMIVYGGGGAGAASGVYSRGGIDWHWGDAALRIFDTGAVRTLRIGDNGGSGQNVNVVMGMNGNVGIGTTAPGAKLDVNGSLNVSGNFFASGTKSSVVETQSYGRRLLFAAEQPSARFQDEGRGRLKGGAARVALDPIFAEAIEGELHIQLTPLGPASLYVSAQGPDWFEVQSADPLLDVEFFWTVSAFRKGFSARRLPAADSTP